MINYKEKRIKAGVTSYDLQRAGICQATYNQIESGGDYKTKTLRKYLEVINKKKRNEKQITKKSQSPI